MGVLLHAQCRRMSLDCAYFVVGHMYAASGHWNDTFLLSTYLSRVFTLDILQAVDVYSLENYRTYLVDGSLLTLMKSRGGN